MCKKNRCSAKCLWCPGISRAHCWFIPSGYLKRLFFWTRNKCAENMTTFVSATTFNGNDLSSPLRRNIDVAMAQCLLRPTYRLCGRTRALSKYWPSYTRPTFVALWIQVCLLFAHPISQLLMYRRAVLKTRKYLVNWRRAGMEIKEFSLIEINFFSLL